MHCNHELTHYIEELIGTDYQKDATRLEDLLKYKNDENVLNRLLEIKYNKTALRWNTLRELRTLILMIHQFLIFR